jgi:glycosyltransferase involved in cell wall biosynthesis
VIPNGIDLKRFSTSLDVGDARSSLGLPSESVIVAAVGRLTEQKGLVDLVDAFGLLASALPTAHLVFAGAGEEETRLKARVSALGIRERVTFLGFQEDVPRVLAAADVFCMPSHWEGFGLALAEALASGTACVSTDVDSLPEVLGDAGLLVPAKSPARLSEALAHVLGDRDARAELGRRGPAQAAQFDVKRMVRAYEALYEELLRR